MNFLRKLTFSSKHVAHIRFNGGINRETVEPYRPIFDTLNRKAGNLEAVAVSITSTGGSAVQSDIFTETVRGICKKNNIPYLIFIDKVAASGGYWIACAGDKVYSTNTAIIGSVGVVFTKANFNFFAARHGFNVTSLNLDENDRSGTINWMKEASDKDFERIESFIQPLGERFYDHVRKYRGNKLDKAEEDKIFNAHLYGAKDALKFGLIDEINSFSEVMKRDFPKSEYKNYVTKNQYQKIFKDIMGAQAIKSII